MASPIPPAVVHRDLFARTNVTYGAYHHQWQGCPVTPHQACVVEPATTVAVLPVSCVVREGSGPFPGDGRAQAVPFRVWHSQSLTQPECSMHQGARMGVLLCVCWPTVPDGSGHGCHQLTASEGSEGKETESHRGSQTGWAHFKILPANHRCAGGPCHVSVGRAEGLAFTHMAVDVCVCFPLSDGYVTGFPHVPNHATPPMPDAKSSL